MITLTGTCVSNAVEAERPDREIRWETIRVAKSEVQGRHPLDLDYWMESGVFYQDYKLLFCQEWGEIKVSIFSLLTSDQ